ncbi:MAG TPA: HIT domain-containing protein [Bryobacteraceae bacterium]|nr:HIT domain-containing protein [Bryobacteraceae bacterium]
MDHLWSPWRYHYLVGAQGKAPGCIFCNLPKEDRDEENLIVHRGRHNFVILNRFPYTSGHAMVVPYRHVDRLHVLEAAEASEMMGLAQLMEKHIREIYKPDGLNLGMNIGESAGAGIAGHIHMHILPRWTGDSNFMTTVGETRVLPEDLDVTWKRFTKAFTTTEP